MRSQGNLKSEVLQSYNLQSSYQTKGGQINGQKNSRNGQNRSTNLGYPSMMSPTTANSYGYNQLAKNSEPQGYSQQYSNPTSMSTQLTPTGKSLSFSNATPLQYSKLANSIDTSSAPPAHQNNGLGMGANNNNQYGFSKQAYGYGNYNTIDHIQGSGTTESNYLYNGYRSQSKRLSNTANSTNQSASNIIGYNGISSNNQSGVQGGQQSQVLSQQVNNKNSYSLQDNIQLQLPKLSPHEGILMSRQMNGSVSEKASLRPPVIEFESTLNSGSRKQDPPSKNNLRNIVKYYNTNGQQSSSNPYSSPLQQSVSVQSVENQPQKQLVSIGSSIQSRQPSSNIPSSHNLKEQQVNNNSNNQTLNGNNNANSINSSSNYYSVSSARPPSNGTGKKDVGLSGQFMQYSSLGKNLNYLSSPTTQSSKIQNSQQSILSPNSKSSRLQSGENSQKTPLKSIQPAQVTGYSSIFNQNTINQPTQLSVKQSIQANPINNDLLDIRMLPKIDKSKISTKQIGVVHAYGANTHQGLIRGYNEDRVSIILNMVKPQEKSHIAEWPNISFFAIYDGHGGAQCADFLRDQLHFYIIKDEEFPKNPQRAIHNGFVKAEDAFIKITESQVPLDKSGSCAIVVMLINEQIYVANLGDSRAVLSQNNGSKVIGLTVDHKPNHPDEEKRIIMNGGKIYQSQIPTMQPKQYPQFVKGPHRVLPGRLAVSRTLGDIEAKLKKYGGNSKVILCEPEITQFQLSSEHDFIMLGCDGIFDKLTNNQSIDFIWEQMRETYRKKENRQNLHDYIGEGIEYLIKQTLIHKSFDNLTVVIICFKNLEKLFQSGPY